MHALLWRLTNNTIMNWKAPDILRMKILRSVFTETSSWKAVFLWSLICNHYKPEVEFQGRTQPKHRANLYLSHEAPESGVQCLGSRDTGVCVLGGLFRGHPSERQRFTTNLSASSFLEQNPRKIGDRMFSFSAWHPRCSPVSTQIQEGWPCLVSKPRHTNCKTNAPDWFSDMRFWAVACACRSVYQYLPGQEDTTCISLQLIRRLCRIQNAQKARSRGACGKPGKRL